MPPGLHAAHVQTGMGVQLWRHPVETYLLAVFFMQLSRRETHPHIVRLPLSSSARHT
jgi:hypothetical protein